jgi:hypothetical protein
VPQQLAQQRGVLGADAALQRLPQRRQLGPQATLGQHRRVVGSCDQAVPHRPAGDAQHVGGDRAQRDPASSKTCCSRWASRVRSQSSALRSRVRSRSSRIGWWHQPGSDQAVGDQLADRHRVGHVGHWSLVHPCLDEGWLRSLLYGLGEGWGAGQRRSPSEASKTPPRSSLPRASDRQ